MTAEAFLKYKNWAVVGDVLNETKYAHIICAGLEKEGYRVFRVNPRSHDSAVYRKIGDITERVEVIDLVIHPKLGLAMLEEAAALGINKVLIQPGAESEELRLFCQKQQITAVEGCVLKALSGNG